MTYIPAFRFNGGRMSARIEFSVPGGRGFFGALADALARFLGEAPQVVDDLRALQAGDTSAADFRADAITCMERHGFIVERFDVSFEMDIRGWRAEVQFYRTVSSVRVSGSQDGMVFFTAAPAPTPATPIPSTSYSPMAFSGTMVTSSRPIPAPQKAPEAPAAPKQPAHTPIFPTRHIEV